MELCGHGFNIPNFAKKTLLNAIRRLTKMFQFVHTGKWP